MRKSLKTIPLLISAIFLTSCSAILFKTMGLKKGKELTQNQIQEQALKYGINKSESFEIDTSYFSYVMNKETATEEQIKNHIQPLQVLYYDKNGDLISYNVNCSVGGFPNLKWNKYGAFDEFPPISQTKVDSLIGLNEHLALIQNTDTIATQNYDLFVLVHWSRFMGRQSKRLINEVKNNISLNEKHKVKVLYVNTDNMWANVESE